MILFVLGARRTGKSWLLQQLRDVVMLEHVEYHDDLTWQDVEALELPALRAAAAGKLVIISVIYDSRPTSHAGARLRALGRRWGEIVPVGWVEAKTFFLPEVE